MIYMCVSVGRCVCRVQNLSSPPLYFVFENSKNPRNDLARPVMGTIFLASYLVSASSDIVILLSCTTFTWGVVFVCTDDYNCDLGYVNYSLPVSISSHSDPDDGGGRSCYQSNQDGERSCQPIPDHVGSCQSSPDHEESRRGSAQQSNPVRGSAQQSNPVRGVVISLILFVGVLISLILFVGVLNSLIQFVGVLISLILFVGVLISLILFVGVLNSLIQFVGVLISLILFVECSTV